MARRWAWRKRSGSVSPRSLERISSGTAPNRASNASTIACSSPSARPSCRPSSFAFTSIKEGIDSVDITLYATPSEFLRDVLREKKERMEAAELRDGIIEGYRDLIAGRVVEFKGDLRKSMQEAKRREAKGWK